MATKTTGAGFPSTIGACLDRLRQLEMEKSQLMGQIKVVADAYHTLEQHVLEQFSESDLKGASGILCRAEVRSEPYPNVEDWDRFYAFIKKTGSWELLQKRIGLNAWRERLEQNSIVPGTTVFNKVSLRLLAPVKKAAPKAAAPAKPAAKKRR